MACCACTTKAGPGQRRRGKQHDSRPPTQVVDPARARAARTGLPARRIGPRSAHRVVRAGARATLALSQPARIRHGRGVARGPGEFHPPGRPTAAGIGPAPATGRYAPGRSDLRRPAPGSMPPRRGPLARGGARSVLFRRPVRGAHAQRERVDRRGFAARERRAVESHGRRWRVQEPVGAGRRNRVPSRHRVPGRAQRHRALRRGLARRPRAAGDARVLRTGRGPARRSLFRSRAPGGRKTPRRPTASR